LRVPGRRDPNRKNLIQHGGRRSNLFMNKHGNPKTLVAAQPGNTNAAKHGAYSPRLIAPRAAEIVDQLTQSFDFTVTQRFAVEQVGSCTAILEAIDLDLGERGVVDKRGEPRSLLNYRSSILRQLGHWLAKIESTIERQSVGEQIAAVGRADYVRELQRIALGQDTSASARDRIAAIKELRSIESAGSGGSVTVRLFMDKEGKVLDVVEDPPETLEADQL
jgi:hypothetical protein